ncbi:hypothetical protein [Paenibacillus catalpae]|uniref:hypothetical protein n=1 Tax=Paenibacillus catalpae TaxID=1045775 RepID=UPI001FEA013D|nr:hypothetical protein [Paenibacillus catalpae]
MKNEQCDLIQTNGIMEKNTEIIDGYTIKYHATGKTIWSKGKMTDEMPDGYWEWYGIVSMEQ